MKITGNEPAYGGKMLVEREATEIQKILGNHSSQLLPVEYSGLTIRQQFAMAAMQGILTTIEGFTEIGDALSKTIASESCLCADALIAELNRTEEQK